MTAILVTVEPLELSTIVWIFSPPGLPTPPAWSMLSAGNKRGTRAVYKVRRTKCEGERWAGGGEKGKGEGSGVGQHTGRASFCQDQASEQKPMVSGARMFMFMSRCEKKRNH